MNRSVGPISMRFVEAKLSYFSCQGCGSTNYDVISEENARRQKGHPRHLAVIVFVATIMADAKSADLCGLAMHQLWHHALHAP